MPFPFLPLAAAGASALGGYLASRGQKAANERNIAQAREQMAFQERMSGTSYQRAVKDMRLAGINPMLAYQQGGASTPGGAKAETQSTLGPAVSSAVAARRVSAEIDAIRVGIEKTRAETDAIRGRPGRILEPAVDAGVGLSRALFSDVGPRAMTTVRRAAGYAAYEAESSARSIAETVARLSKQGLAAVRATIGRFIPRRGN